MLTIKRTDATDPHFRELVKLLDADLAIRDGDDHAFYNAINQAADLRHTIVAYSDGVAVACGALKVFEDGVMEIKRMYVLPSHRRQGIARQVLEAVEAWARELNQKACVLETGRNQPEAIALYRRSGYAQTPNYGKYAGVENSLCFRKEL